MSIALVVTAGFGNGTFNGTVKDVVLRGYGIGEVIITPEDGDSVLAFIDSQPLSLNAAIDNDGMGVETLISEFSGVEVIISANGSSVTTNIDDDGLGVETEI